MLCPFGSQPELGILAIYDIARSFCCLLLFFTLKSAPRWTLIGIAVIMDLIVDADLAVGNGILTFENDEQAWARAKVGDKNKGGAAARAALDMIALRERLGV